MPAHTRFIYLFPLAVAAMVSFGGCNNKQQIAQNTPNKPAPGDAPISTPLPNVTSASVKANDAESGNSNMERYATKEAKDAVAFDVRGDKLESVVNDTKLGVSFGAPRGFRSLNYTSLLKNDIARKFTAYSSDEIAITPLYSFSNGQNSLVVSLIKPIAAQTMQQFVGLYEALNKQRFAPANITITSFKNRDIPMTQLFIQETEDGLFRIVFPLPQKNQFLQFDYTVRRSTIQADMERIEPSIGSIVRIDATLP